MDEDNRFPCSRLVIGDAGVTHVDDLSVSPDGAHVLFWGNDDPTVDGGALYALPVDGSAGPQQLTDVAPGTDADATWSPDGRRIAFRRIIAPQALRFAIPGLGNVWQLALKESALISVVGLTELLRQAQVGAGSTRQPFEFFITAAALYLVLSTFSGMAFERAEAAAMRGVRRT